MLPLDLAERMASGLAQEDADIAVVSAQEMDEDGKVSLRPQPVFCLMHMRMLESLLAFTRSGGRKIGAWTAQHKTVSVPFDKPSDDAMAFFNANTLADLHLLESRLRW